jgi:hypothetical protein
MPRRRPVTAAALGSADERRMRRYVAHQTGEQLRDELPTRKVIANHNGHAKKALQALKKEFGLKGFGFGAPLIHEVTTQMRQPELATASMRRVAARGRVTPPVARKETLEYYWMARKPIKNSPVVNARMVKVEADKEGEVLRTQVLVSS